MTSEPLKNLKSPAAIVMNPLRCRSQSREILYGGGAIISHLRHFCQSDNPLGIRLEPGPQAISFRSDTLYLRFS